MWPAAARATLGALDRAAGGLDALDGADRVPNEARDLGVLDDVDAELARRASRTPTRPGHGGRRRPRRWSVAPSTGYRTSRRDVHDRAELADLARASSHSASTPFSRFACTRRIEERTSPRSCARFITPRWLNAHVPVELGLEPLPQLQRVLVHRRRLVEQVVRADDRRVARHVPAGEPPLLHDADVGEAVVPRQVVGRGQPVPAAPDHDRLVGALRIGGAPQRRFGSAARGLPVGGPGKTPARRWERSTRRVRPAQPGTGFDRAGGASLA